MNKQKELESRLLDPRNKLSLDLFLDLFPAVCSEVKRPQLRRNKNFGHFLRRYEDQYEGFENYRLTPDDFFRLKCIGRGAYGEVHLVRRRDDDRVYAMKMLSKSEMIKRSDTASFWEERDIMAFADSEWVVKMHYSLQDDKFLYMIMEFLNGGDLVNLMARFDEEITEDWGRFYTAEMILALDAVHRMGFVHRDVKPDNMLLDSRGHLKLADFGLAILMDENGLVRSSVAIGTPDYISPEVLASQEAQGVYGRECDWWSVGIILYEMMVGECPFYSESLVGTYRNIMNHESALEFPPDVQMSGSCVDFIRRTLTTRDKRLGARGVEDLKSHAFFNNADWTWENIRNRPAPVDLELTGDDDTTNFEDIEDEEVNTSFENCSQFIGNHLPFVGFTFNSEYSAFSEEGAGVSSAEMERVAKESVEWRTKANENLSKYNDAQRELIKAREEQKDTVNNEQIIANFENQLDNSRRECDQEKEKARRFKTKHDELQKTLIDLQEKYKGMQETKALLKSKIEELELQITDRDSLKNNVNELQSQNAKLTKAGKDQERELTSLKASLTSLENTARNNKKLQEQYNNLQTENMLFGGRIKELEETNFSLKETLEKDKHTMSGLDKQIVELKKAKASAPVATTNENADSMELLRKQHSDLEIDFKEVQSKFEQAVDDNTNLRKRVDELKEKLSEREETVIELQQLCRGTEGEKEQLRQQVEEITLSIKSKEEEIERQRAQQNQLCEENTDLSKELGQLKSKMGEENQRYKSLEEHLTAKGNEFDALKKEHNDALLKKEATSDRNKKYEDQVNDLQGQLKDKVNEMSLIQEQHLRTVGHKNDRIEVLENDVVILKEQRIKAEGEKGSAAGKDEQIDKLNKDLTELHKKWLQEKNFKELTITKLEQVCAITQGKPGPKDSGKQKMDRLNRAMRQTKQQLEKSEERNVTQAATHAREIEKMQAELEGSESSKNELKNILTSKETEILELLRRIKVLEGGGTIEEVVVKKAAPEVTLECFLSTPHGKNLRKTNNWKRLLAVCTADKIMLYDSEADKVNRTYSLSIDISKITSVTSLEQGTLWRISASSVPRLLKINYNSKDAPAPELDVSLTSCNGTEFNGHHFMALPIADPQWNCYVCAKRLKSFLKTEAYECQRCHIKVHKNHVEQEERNLVACTSGSRTLILLADDVKTKQTWEERLNRSIKPAVPGASSVESKVSPRTLPRQHSTSDKSGGIFRRHSERPVGSAAKSGRNKNEIRVVPDSAILPVTMNVSLLSERPDPS